MDFKDRYTLFVFDLSKRQLTYDTNTGSTPININYYRTPTGGAGASGNSAAGAASAAVTALDVVDVYAVALSETHFEIDYINSTTKILSRF